MAETNVWFVEFLEHFDIILFQVLSNFLTKFTDGLGDHPTV